MLVALVYGLPGLDWSNPTDHAELFSGSMSVTIGELEAPSFDEMDVPGQQNLKGSIPLNLSLSMVPVDLLGLGWYKKHI